MTSWLAKLSCKHTAKGRRWVRMGRIRSASPCPRGVAMGLLRTDRLSQVPSSRVQGLESEVGMGMYTDPYFNIVIVSLHADAWYIYHASQQ